MVSLSLSCLSLSLLKTFELRIPLPKIHVVLPQTLLKQQIQKTRLQLKSYIFSTKLMSLSHRGRFEHMKQNICLVTKSRYCLELRNQINIATT